MNRQPYWTACVLALLVIGGIVGQMVFTGAADAFCFCLSVVPIGLAAVMAVRRKMRA